MTRIHTLDKSVAGKLTTDRPAAASPAARRASDSLTSEEIRAADPVEKFFGSTVPEFIRVPDVEKIFGIKRGHLYALIAAGAVRSVCLRRPGSKTGVRLVHFQSVRDYLNRQLT